jgi:DNA-binding NtrC family response regulator
VKTDCRKKSLTFGEFIECAYDAWGKRKASGMVRLALQAHLMEFCGQKRFLTSPGATQRPRRILVVDDDTGLRQLETEVLIRHGYQVDAARDSTAGWKALQAHTYDLLITDFDMPRLSGLNLVKRLRAARMALPVVMAAGRLPTCQLARNPSLQLAATLVKPFAGAALLDTVNNALRATVRPREQNAPPPNGQSQPSAVGWQL